MKVKGKCPRGRLRFYRHKSGMLIYTEQQPGWWLINTINGHRLREGNMLKAMDMKALPKSVKIVSVLMTGSPKTWHNCSNG
jgi:hypothetical protein